MYTGKISIGLTYTGNEAKHLNYVNWLKGSDNIEVIRLSVEDNNLEKLFAADAIVLSGGIDAHPKNYGSSITSYPNAPEKFNEERDDFETAVFKTAVQQQLPVLAICRGMQLVNCILGGDLIQDLGEEKNELHRLTDIGKKHSILIEPGSLLYHITQTEKDTADSAHHQCINHLGKDLLINARSDDGMIEGIEWADKEGKAFFLGVQWHPERMYLQQLDTSTLSKNIREYFLKETINNKLK
ncbi:MAG TPA: gamma-glutamyl-gamma-aminobutyrate hydrolase family protein [Ferruginibacter sp.]|nr:gamma-glutamyl-gamma-aminobutyrate hydrolase family protein [Ferruginibacter sp.]